MMKWNMKSKKGILKKAAAVMLAVVTLAGMSANGVMPASQVKADEALPGYVRSVYTNEWIPAEQSVVRPIAVMMPTDKVAQPSYGISNADILYEIMEEGEISRQMAVISNWTGLSKIGNVRSCRAYYLPEATEWDPIIIHFGGVFYMQDRITAPDINNISGTNQYGTGGGAPGAGAFFRTSDRKAPHMHIPAHLILSMHVQDLDILLISERDSTIQSILPLQRVEIH